MAKLEIRISKPETNSKLECSKPSENRCFEIFILEIRICFEFRASDFILLSDSAPLKGARRAPLHSLSPSSHSVYRYFFYRVFSNLQSAIGNQQSSRWCFLQQLLLDPAGRRFPDSDLNPITGVADLLHPPPRFQGQDDFRLIGGAFPKVGVPLGDQENSRFWRDGFGRGFRPSGTRNPLFRRRRRRGRRSDLNLPGRGCRRSRRPLGLGGRRNRGG